MTLSWPPIIVTGGWGSGTTLLRSMLNSHPAIFIPYETFYLRELWENREALGLTSVRGDEEVRRLFAQFLETSHVSLIMQDIPEGEFLDALLAVPAGERSYASLLAALSEVPMRRQGKGRWGAKNPNFVNHLDTIYALYPDAYVIHIIRDGRAVAASRQGKKIKVAQIKGAEPPAYPTFETPSGESVSFQLLNYAADWHGYIQIARRQTAQANSARYLEIGYERLLAEPHAVLEQICAFIEAPFAEGMLRYYEQVDEQLPDTYFRDQHTNIAQPPDPAIAQRWREKLSPAVIYAIQKAIGPALKGEGYRLVEVEVSAVDRRTIDQNVAAWQRERARKALRRGLGNMPLLRQARAAYRAVRQRRSGESP
jgi:hypothetical protein